MFENVKGYKTEVGAIKKLQQATGCETIADLDQRFRWMVGINSGRFFPLVLGSTEGTYSHLATAGIAVV